MTRARRAPTRPLVLAFSLLSACSLFALGCGGGQGTQTAARTPDGATDAQPASDGGASGPTAPDFSLPTLEGGQVSLSDYQGKKVVLIDFWSTTCHPCLQEMPELAKIYDEKKAQGFEILAISVDGPDTASNIPAAVKSSGMNFPVLLDEETSVMDRYNPKGEMPFTVLVNKHGRIVLKRAGYQPGDKASMETLVAAIDAALAE